MDSNKLGGSGVGDDSGTGYSVLSAHSHAPHNDVSVNDGPPIRQWSHNTII